MPIDRPDWSNGEVVPVEDRSAPNALPADAASELDEALTDDTVAGRYRQTAAGVAVAPLSWSEARGQLPAALVSEWSASQAPDGHHLAQAQSAALAAFERLEPDDRDELIASFDGLSEGVRTAILTELGLGGAAIVRNASDTEIAEFKALPEGAIAAARWRGRTGKNLATVDIRIKRMLTGMTEGEREAAADWYSGLSPEAQAGLLDALVR